MIATFLRQEFDSVRFGPSVRAILEQERIPMSVVSAPDVVDSLGNSQRKRILGLHRGYGSAEDLYLSGFPTADVRWDWCVLTPAEVSSIKYIDWDYWLALTEGSRCPADGARRILAGVRIYDVPNDNVVASAAALRSGIQFPPLILISAGEDAPLVVLEGHARLTAYALAPDCVPPEVTVLIGTSPAIADWDHY